MTRGRPTTKPRLRKITAETLRADMPDQVHERWHATIESLFRYATGERVGLVAEKLRQATFVLYGAPARTETIAPSKAIVGAEGAREYDVVLLAAEARLQIESGERVTRRGLAALASVSPVEVSRMIREGRLGAPGDGRAGAAITPGAAARWLRERGMAIRVGK